MLVSMVGTVSAYYYEDTGGGYTVSSDSQSNFYIPEYTSHKEILTKLVAPFLLVTIILQMGLYRAMIFTFADSPSLSEELSGDSKEKARIRKQAMMMALIIAGMLVPTPFFGMINDVVAVIFGGAVYVFLAVILGYFLLAVFSGSDD